jgi:hypothetical protein
LRNGSDGGERGFEATSPPPFLVRDGTSLPEKKKTKKPMHRMAARIMVMGFERRNERDIVGGRLEEKANRGCQNARGL